MASKAKSKGKAASKKVPSKMNKEECLVELKAMTAELEFDRVYTVDDSIDVLRKAVAEGRKALKIPAPATPTVGGAGDAPAANAAEPAEPAEPQTAPKGPSIDIVTGSVPNVRYIRTYSKETHGDEYKELAEQFVAKHAGKLKCRMVPSGEVDSLMVRWEEIERDPKTGVALNEGRLVAKNRAFKGKSEKVKEEALAHAKTVGGQVFVR